MNRIEEYLNTLDKKNLFFLYSSVIIVAFIIYYNFNYNILQEKIDNYNNEIFSLQENLQTTNDLKKKLLKLKTEFKQLKKENMSLSEDLKYLNVLVNTTSILHIDEKHFMNILKKILEKAVKNNIKASYIISKETDRYKNYVIRINGVFEPKDFINFYRFIKNLEKIKAIKEIEYLKLEKKEKVQFDLKIVFWGLL